MSDFRSKKSSGGGTPRTLLGAGLSGIGTAMDMYGQYLSSRAREAAEQRNAQFYREQAEFSALAGRRQRSIFDRETVVQIGEQESAFARAGVDTASSSLFLAGEIFARDLESMAIQMEADMNVRLAQLRAQEAERSAAGIRRARPLEQASSLIEGLTSIL